MKPIEQHPFGPNDRTDAWGAPDMSLIGSGRRAAPAFPLHVLGPTWGSWAKGRAQGASAPVDYVATALLTCVGATLANVRWPVAGAHWSEPPLLWAAAVGDPSSSKSPAIDAALDMIEHAERSMAADYEEERQRHVTAKQIAEAKRDAWKAEVKQAVASGQTPPSLPTDATEPEAPARKRIRVADSTIEKLAVLASETPRGLLLVRDEVAGWLGSFDKYGGGGSDRAFAIEMYGGRSYVVDRVKNPEPITIRHLSIGVLGGVQPEKVGLITKGPDDGLASRILWSWPDAVSHFTLHRAAVEDTAHKDAFLRLAELTLGSDLHGKPAPIRVRLTPEAENLLEEFAREMNARIREASGLFASALGKARGHVLRLSAVIEFLWWAGSRGQPEPTTISERAVKAAAGLMDGYFLPMTEKVVGDASIPEPERVAMFLAREIRKRGLSGFNARDLRREIGGAVREADSMNAACAVLVEASIIRPKGGSGMGRPAKAYDVNPALRVNLQ